MKRIISKYTTKYNKTSKFRQTHIILGVMRKIQKMSKTKRMSVYFNLTKSQYKSQ